MVIVLSLKLVQLFLNSLSLSLLQSRFRVLPLGSHALTYNLYPVQTGMVALPHLDLSCQRYPTTMDQVTSSAVSSSIFIKVCVVCVRACVCVLYQCLCSHLHSPM